MTSLTDYADVLDDVLAETVSVRDRLRAAGVHDEKIIVDPGLGFAKTGEQNWTLIRGIERFLDLGHKVLVAASRKRFLGELLTTAGKAAEPEQRDAATAAITAVVASRGAWGVRVHDVAPNLDAVKVAARARA
jgi:dihydropteroate synthase